MRYILIIFMFILALVGLFKDYFSEHHWFKKYRPLLIWIVCVFLILITGCQILLEYFDMEKKSQTKWSGKLQSPFKTEEKAPVLVLGRSQLVWTGDSNTPMFNLAGEPLFLRLVNGKAQLSVVVRDENGIVFAMIRDNQWFVVRPPQVLDCNFNKNMLEFKDPKGDIVFQVQIEGEKVYIAGRFYSKEGKGPIFFTPWLHDLQGRKDSLFRYPSIDYPGKLQPKINE